MNTLMVSIDVGGSLTKVIYQASGMHRPGYLCMPPDVEPVNPQTLQNYLDRGSWLGQLDPIRQAWVTTKDETWVVGEFASNFHPQDRLEEKKYENALYKVLAVIGVLVQKCFPPEKQKEIISVRLGILLPANEYNDQTIFKKALGELGQKFQFRGAQMRLKFSSVMCRPEGGGLMMIRARTQKMDWFKSKRVVVLMFGHRNTTFLYFDRGEIKEDDSPDNGFSRLLDLVVKQTSALNPQSICEAIFEGVHAARQANIDMYRNSSLTFQTHHPDWSEVPAIQELIKTRNPELRKAEIERLGKAIKNATDEYWASIAKWLERKMPKQVDEVIISGGAAVFLEPELERHFNCKGKYSNTTNGLKKTYEQANYSKPFIQIVWDADVVENVHNTFILRTSDRGWIGSRLTDAYGLFDALIAKANEEAQKELCSK